ncbi:MAG: ankyrin repeat domain-containing protein [Burkholderiales bacterium]
MRWLVFLVVCLAFSAPAQPGTDAALIEAAARADVGEVRRLLGQGASVRARDAQSRTPLLAATQSNCVECARLLIGAGADVNAKDAISDSPYLLAGARGRLDILRLTLAAGADLKSTNRFGGTALIPACHYGHVDTVRELLKTRVAIDHVNNLGWTCLLEAVILGDGGPAYVEIVRMVLAAGANPNLADRQGLTALGHARSRGQAAVIPLLVEAGAK